MDCIDVLIVPQAAAGSQPARATSVASPTSQPARRPWAVLAAAGIVTLAAYLMHGRLASEAVAIGAAESIPEAALEAPEPAASKGAVASTPSPSGAPSVTTPVKPTAKVAKAAPPASATARETVPGAVVAVSPRQACGELNALSMVLCLSRECQNPRWQAHPQCVEPRRIEAQRQRDLDRL
jgi:hypothetical protein